jgi:hypothetical protein
MVSWFALYELVACLQVPPDSHSPLNVSPKEQNFDQRLEFHLAGLYRPILLAGRLFLERLLAARMSAQ